ncbi:MAG: hypothetical protein Q7J68_01620 [Thermoplasmata archaeon]|nr:hypothetical protein [Thermoplasmata archaeon]
MTSDEATELKTQAVRCFGPRKIVWSIVAVICVISLIFSAMAGFNYTELVKAKVLTYVTTDEIVTLAFDSSGYLESVNLTLNFNMVNPSQKDIKAWIITYKGWVRDIPYEDGTDRSRWRVDGTILVNGTDQAFFPVFASSYSFDNPAIIIPGNSNFSVTRYIILNRTNYPDIMAGVESILNQTTVNGTDLEWMHYTSAILLINDIPPYSGPNKDANVIRRIYGVDITPGIGGAGS